MSNEESVEKSNLEINTLLNQLDEAHAEAEYWRDLNVRLLQISKERANADRKLQPRKRHPGYILTQSKEKEIKYQEEILENQEGELFKKKLRTKTVWETSIQSPYSIDFSAEQARTQIREELLSGSEFKLHELGIDVYNPVGFQTLFTSQEYNVQTNYVCETRLTANVKAGYWEITIVHTLPLTKFEFNWINR